MGLCKVVEIDKNKCANCDTCISVCPIKYCFISDGSELTINNDLCIDCGRCYNAYPHNAINYYVDDFQDFLDALNHGQKNCNYYFSPAISSSFFNQENKFLTYLKENWAIPFFLEEGVGAELAILKYENYIKKSE